MMIKNFICYALLTALTAVFTFGQKPSPTMMPSPIPQIAPTPVDLEMVLTEAEKQTAFYQETFKDLLATEIKTFEKYDKTGDLDERTVIESNFLVYQSSENANRILELRNVLKVDDKLIPDSRSRADRFLGELAKKKTFDKELEKLESEGLRYDRTVRISNLTLYEAITLAKNLRPFFDFKLVSTENYDGSEVFVVSYQQTRKSPFITIDEKESNEPGVTADFDISLPGALKKSDKFLRGKLWIDAKTFQIRREERLITVQSNSTPLVAQESVFEYAPSEFGILVPKKITFTDNNLRKISKDKEYSAVKNTKVIFDYSKFKKTSVEVNIIDEP
ncbi:MAG: hypothetical protein LH614_09730 [Pyrinomonadaceae bacterium]|nr:hypothetical protein [Pyrinomonadaceae bacterium]